MSELFATMALRRGSGPDAFALEVEMTCPPGITCLIGPSGSGKSTTLAVIAGLAVPDRGQVVLGKDVWFDRAKQIDVPVHHRRVSYMFQGLALFPHMTAIKNVEYGMHELPREERTAKALALLERMGVKQLAYRKPRTLSGGEAQRVAFARALGRQPRLLLLDEPFSALDRDLRGQLVTLVRDVVAEEKVPLLHVTHSLGEARQLADQVIRIDKGRVVARGKADEVLANIASLDD